MILPIQTVILPGRREKNSTKAKNTAEKISRYSHSAPLSPSMGATPVVKDTVAHLGMANSGPMVRYSRQVKKMPYPLLTLPARVCKPSEWVMPMAATPKTGIPTAVMIKPIMAGMAFRPAICPRWTGKIRLPAPKNMPNSVPATNSFCRIVSFFVVMEHHLLYGSYHIGNPCKRETQGYNSYMTNRNT